MSPDPQGQGSPGLGSGGGLPGLPRPRSTRGAAFSARTTFSEAGGCQMRAGGAPCARPSHLSHPAIKPKVKYLLNDAIRPAAHYGVYLAIKYWL